MAGSNDQLLIERIRSKDERAWASLVSMYEGRLRGFLIKRLNDKSLCDDLVQETFLGFVTSLPNYDPRTPLESFLFAIASHKLTDHLRRSGRRPSFRQTNVDPNSDSVTLDDLPGSARHASSLARSREQAQLDEQKLKLALQDLITRWVAQREFERLMCMELLLVRGWQNKRVAEELRLSEQEVANHKSYVVRQLAKAVGE